MLVHVSPFEEDVGETTYSLSFAKRARAVESTKELPEVLLFNFLLATNILGSMNVESS